MDDEQFKELMECLEGISSRLDAIETTVSSVEGAVSGVEGAVSGVETAVTSVEYAVSAVKDNQPEYCAYNFEDVVKALWEVKDAVIDNGS